MSTDVRGSVTGEGEGAATATATAARGGPDGWADLPGDTALSIQVPEANHLVSTGFQAHVTVLYPFLGASRLSASAHADLTEVFAAHAPFTLTFTEFRRYPGVLYLPPEPEAPVRALTASLTDRWPEAVPYRGIFTPPLAPHLTLANHEGPDTYEAAYDALEARLAPHLPLVSQVNEVHLMVTDGAGGWRDLRTYRLGGGTSEPALCDVRAKRV
ncbi:MULTISPECIES: 2'-5' RNA ligase family protein [Streptomyces]|uniref:2'-5' RNA ligase family protein n=1 Tax=Streptomyces TaxID=1883 RepID=UPI001E57CA67|nr:MULTISPECIES: 2'-5' RNA ligase family protein [Streptomyces]UFQ15009.1 2'-5' RNA ligase family protein [Streptomyces huasconensis]WCL84615.1 2'-5' RNA ligase family protein [Streptomyces sp. JCM 35825]